MANLHLVLMLICFTVNFDISRGQAVLLDFGEDFNDTKLNGDHVQLAETGTVITIYGDIRLVPGEATGKITDLESNIPAIVIFGDDVATDDANVYYRVVYDGSFDAKCINTLASTCFPQINTTNFVVGLIVTWNVTNSVQGNPDERNIFQLIIGVYPSGTIVIFKYYEVNSIDPTDLPIIGFTNEDPAKILEVSLNETMETTNCCENGVHVFLYSNNEASDPQQPVDCPEKCDACEVYAAVVEQWQRLQVRTITINELKNDVKEYKRARGATYTRWGKDECDEDSETVYNGYIASTDSSNPGGSSKPICFPADPMFVPAVDRVDSDGNTDCNKRPRLMKTDYSCDHKHPKFAPCAVCRTKGRSSVKTVPGKYRCDDDWSMEYKGYVMSGQEHAPSNSDFLCMDKDMRKLVPKVSPAKGVFDYTVADYYSKLPCVVCSM